MPSKSCHQSPRPRLAMGDVDSTSSSCCLSLSAGVQLGCAASLCAHVAGAAAGVAALERRRARMEGIHLGRPAVMMMSDGAAGGGGGDAAAAAAYAADYDFWLDDPWPRVALAWVALGLCDVNACAMALWAARIRSRWLLAPYLALRAAAAAALLGGVAFQTVRLLVKYATLFPNNCQQNIWYNIYSIYACLKKKIKKRQPSRPLLRGSPFGGVRRRRPPPLRVRVLVGRRGTLRADQEGGGGRGGDEEGGGG